MQIFKLKTSMQRLQRSKPFKIFSHIQVQQGTWLHTSAQNQGLNVAHGTLLGPLVPGHRLVVGIVSRFGFGSMVWPHTNGAALSSASASQSSVMTGFTQELTGTCHLLHPLSSSWCTDILFSQVSVCSASSCLGTRWRALKGQVFSSLASFGWFFLHFIRW